MLLSRSALTCGSTSLAVARTSLLQGRPQFILQPLVANWNSWSYRCAGSSCFVSSCGCMSERAFLPCASNEGNWKSCGFGIESPTRRSLRRAGGKLGGSARRRTWVAHWESNGAGVGRAGSHAKCTGGGGRGPEGGAWEKIEIRALGTGSVSEVNKVRSRFQGSPRNWASGGSGRRGSGTPCPGPARLLGAPRGHRTEP